MSIKFCNFMVYKKLNFTKVMFYSDNTKEKVLFPIDLNDFIPEGSPVRLISEIIDCLDLSSLTAQYKNSKEGRKGFHPAVMLKAIIFGYMNNIFSLRGLEAAMQRDAHLIWLMGYHTPDFTTISKFKKMCIPYIKDIFSCIVTILAQRGEINSQKICILTVRRFVHGPLVR